MKIIPKFLLGGTLALAAAGVLVTAPLAAAQDAAPATKPPFAHRARMMGFFGGAPLITIALNHKSDLALSDDQVANLEKIKSNYQAQVTPIVQQLQANEKEIAGLMQQTPANLIQVKAKIQEGETYRSELHYLRLEALDNGRSVLSAQQQEQLKSLVRSRHGNFRGPQGQPS
jgi:Spy/CpxP family protein refolding chaperone